MKLAQKQWQGGCTAGLTTAFCLIAAIARAGTDSAPVSFNDDIRPILSEHCFQCHGPDAKARKADLRLDDPAVAYDPLPSGVTAVVPNDLEASALIQRIRTDDPIDRMPPPEFDKPLSENQIARLQQWVESGAPYEEHWAFKTTDRPAVPAVDDDAWPHNAIDRFVLARMEREGIAPSPEADPRTLLRRVYLDLVGLPPSPKASDDFAANPTAAAYEAVVDELLDSPHFGERWGRHWLDAARYADSNGYSIDSPRSIWPYRDYVIDSFNADKPFDRFVREQLAGDLLPDASLESRVATGFLRNTMINEEGGIDKEEFRMEAVADRVNTFGTVFLGLTMSCARCHDHKYDPVSQREYFNLFAFFNNDDGTSVPVPSPEQAEAIEKAKVRRAMVARSRDHYWESQGPAALEDWEADLGLRELRRFTDEERASILVKPEDRTEEDRKRVEALFKKHDDKYREFTKQIARLDREINQAPTTLVVKQRDKPRTTHLLEQGDYTRPAEEVAPGYLDALHPPRETAESRLDLAEWLVDPANPLLARVTVNRFWQRLFGKGLVATENDFGAQGELPTHPPLLNWLAVEFMESGWRIKPLIKSIVMSAVYRQSSRTRPDLHEIDPQNTLLARQNRFRLDAEIIRDSALAAADVLDTTVGGPSIYPPQPESVTKQGQVQRDWPVSDGDERYRRGLYIARWRSTPYYALKVFDAPDAQVACTRRIRSNTPLQALTLLNDQAYFELARAFGSRLVENADVPGPQRIREAFRSSLGRDPAFAEVALLGNLLNKQRQSITPPEAEAICGDRSDASVERAAWIMVARALLNLDEFMTRE